MSNIAIKNDPDSSLPATTSQPLPKLTGKLRLFFRHYTNIDNPKTFFNATESAKCSNYLCKDDNGYATVGKENFRKLQQYIDLWLNDNALSDTALKGKAVELMYAQETKLFTDRDADGNLKIIEHKIPALNIQHKALETSCKIKGLYQDTSQGAMPTFNIMINNTVGQVSCEPGPSPAAPRAIPGDSCGFDGLIEMDLDDDDFSDI